MARFQSPTLGPGDAHKVVLLLDTTRRMPMAAVRPALGAFINLLQPGDRFAVMGYKGRVARVYPADGLATYDDREVLTDATLALESLTAAGRKSNLAAGLNVSSKMLAESGRPNAIVLLGESEWNAGNNPLFKLPDFPVETIAIGENGQTETLQEIAAQTGGTYNLAAEPSSLIAIMLEIVERLEIAQIVATGTRTVGDRQPFDLVGNVGEGAGTATFLVFWGDPEIRHASGERCVIVDLLDPTGQPAGLTPVWAGDGYAVFSVPRPVSGSWTLTATFVGAGTCTLSNAILVA